MDNESRLGHIFKRGEFCETEREHESDRYECLVNNIGLHPKRMALFKALLDHHRNGTPIPNDGDFDLSGLESIVDASTPSMFAAIYPAIKSHDGIHTEFRQRDSSRHALKFVRSDQIDEFVDEYKLDMHDITHAWTYATVLKLSTGPTLSQVIARLRHQKPSSHRFAPPDDVWLTPTEIPGPGGSVVHPDQLYDIATEEDSYNIYLAESILDPDVCDDENVLKELVDLSIGCLLSKEECQWVASIWMSSMRGEEFDVCSKQMLRIVSIALMKGWLGVQPAYWNICPKEWNRCIDRVASCLANRDNGLRGFPHVFQECRSELKGFVQEHIQIPGLSELVCGYLIGECN